MNNKNVQNDLLKLFLLFLVFGTRTKTTVVKDPQTECLF